LTVYQSRISSLQIEDSIQLRYFKGVVATAYKGFPQKLPDEIAPEECFALST